MIIIFIVLCLSFLRTQTLDCDEAVGDCCRLALRWFVATRVCRRFASRKRLSAMLLCVELSYLVNRTSVVIIIVVENYAKEWVGMVWADRSVERRVVRLCCMAATTHRRRFCVQSSTIPADTPVDVCKEQRRWCDDVDSSIRVQSSETYYFVNAKILFFDFHDHIDK